MLPRRTAGLSMKKSSIQVLKEEAVGMYEVAVLSAGSVEALKKWMDKNSYKYPDGMDAVTADYISEGWCFVAVKTKSRAIELLLTLNLDNVE